MVDPGASSPFYDHALCRELGSLGASVELVSAPFAYHPWPAESGYVRSELFPASHQQARAGAAGRHPLWRGIRRLRRGMAYPFAWRRLEAEIVRRPPDVLHLQWTPVPLLERPYVARAVRRGVAVVITVHNAVRHDDEPFRDADRSGLFALASRLIVHSQSSASQLAARHPELAGRISVIAPGVEPPSAGPGAAPPDRAAARERLGLPAEAPIALFAGLIRPYKGVDLLLRAFESLRHDLPEARLAIAGLPTHRSALSRLQSLGAGSQVVLDLGYLPQDRLEAWLIAADLVVLPYRDAGDSAILGAALAADRPVVVSRAGGLAEMLGEVGSEEMLIAPESLDELARALERFLGDRDRAERIGRAKGEEIRARFRWSSAAQATLDLYRHCRRHPHPLHDGEVPAAARIPRRA